MQIRWYKSLWQIRTIAVYVHILQVPLCSSLQLPVDSKSVKIAIIMIVHVAYQTRQ